MAVAVRDPHVGGSWGYCPFRLVTGLDCPGCGGLRAVHDLAHGHVLEALSSNVLAVGLLALAAGAWVVWSADRLRGRPARVRDWVTARSGSAALVLLVVFAVVRNTPWGSALAP